jgi:RNA polymerase sigma factor (sigma-70 family)
VQKAQAFDSYAKKTLKFTARNYYRKKRQRGEREVNFSSLSSSELAKLTVYDTYFADDHAFDVMDWSVFVSDFDLAEALVELPSKKRDIVLLSFFMDMSDGEIAELMELARSTVSHHRRKAMKKLREIMEVGADE